MIAAMALPEETVDRLALIEREAGRRLRDDGRTGGAEAWQPP